MHPIAYTPMYGALGLAGKEYKSVMVRGETYLNTLFSRQEGQVH
jgi:hypothetical protein